VMSAGMSVWCGTSPQPCRFLFFKTQSARAPSEESVGDEALYGWRIFRFSNRLGNARSKRSRR
jgi:hypothetical protein